LFIFNIKKGGRKTSFFSIYKCMNYKVIDIPQPQNCEKCVPCMRMRLMEMGFIEGQEIEVESKRLGLYIVHMLSDNGTVDQTFALRPEELDRICLKENL